MKYRRDISHTLRLLAIFLGLFVLYQVWIKPTYLSPPIPQPTTENSVSAPPSTPTLLPPDNFGPSGVPQTRLVDPGDAPSPQLSQIRENLDRGHYKKVESSLRTLSPQALKHDRAKHFAAALWNNLGIQQEKFGGIAIAVKAFQQAVKLDPKNGIALINLTHAYWGLRDPALTPEFLHMVIRHAPKETFPHLALADILIEQGNHTAAREQLTTVETQAKSDPNLRPYFQQLAARITQPTSAPPPVARTEPIPAAPSIAITRTMPKETAPSSSPTHPAVTPPNTLSAPQADPPEKPFKPRSGDHFSVRFDGKDAPDTWVRIQSILEYAYQDLTQKLGHPPASSIQIVLHTNQNFAADADNPAWTDSLFDATTASIHLPTIGALEDLGLLSRVVRHELAHALIQEKLGAQKHPLPNWLVEGLAIQLAEDPWPDLDDIKDKPQPLIPLSSLQGRWDQIPKESLAVAYGEAALASQHLIDRYSMNGVRQVLAGLRAGLSLDAVMQQKLSVSYEEFTRRWEESAQSAGMQKL